MKSFPIIQNHIKNWALVGPGRPWGVLERTVGGSCGALAAAGLLALPECAQEIYMGYIVDIWDIWDI